MSKATLLSSLRRLGRRFLAVRVAAGLGWGLIAAGLLLLAGAWLDLLWELPSWTRVACGRGALAVGVLLLLYLGGRAWRSIAPKTMARRLDRVAGTGGRILSGVDLLLEQSPHSPLTAGLAEMAVAQANRLAQDVPSFRAVPVKPVYRSLGSLGILALGIVLVGLALPRLAWTQWLRFTDPYGDHPPYARVIYHVEPGDVAVVYGAGLDIRVTTAGLPVERLDLVLTNQEIPDGEMLPMFPEPGGEWKATIANVTAPGRYFVRSREGRSHQYKVRVITVPRIESVRFRIALPAYTNRAAYEGPVPQGGLAGLPGTRVQVWAKSNRPLSGGTLEIPGPEGSSSFPMTPASADQLEATGTFEIRKAGKLQLKVIDVEGQASTETFTAPVELLADERPFVRLIEPRAVSFATPDGNLPVVLSAEDDYGISRLQLFRGLNDSRTFPLDVAVPAPPPLHVSHTLVLPLESYGLAGDEIKIYARVEDNDPAGPKGSESAIAVVRIISAADLERLQRTRLGMEMLLSKYRQAQRRAEGLADKADRLRKKLRQSSPDSALSKSDRKELEEFVEKLRQEAIAIRKLADHQLPYDLEKELTQHLEQMARRLERAAKEQAALAADPKLLAQMAAEALEKLQKELSSETRQLADEALDPLEHLASIYPLLEDAARFVILAQRQRALEERLQSLKGKTAKDDPALKNRMRDLQAEQEAVRTELTKILEDIEDHVARLPNDPKLDELRQSASELVEAVRASGASEAMAEGEAGLAAFSGSRGHEGARQAADLLEKFVSQCEGGMGASGKKCLKLKPTLIRGLGDTLEQLLADAGLQPGNQPGSRGGSGYSSRRNSLDNVGLYGNLPMLDSEQRSGSGEDGRLRPGRGQGRNMVGGQPANAESGAKGAAAGANHPAIPGAYRRRVADYFQRIADEMDGK